MGIHGLLPQIGPGQRISLAKLSAQHYTTNARPFRVAIDISIWLFQIQSGKGGSNPALRTFYYRLLRLLSLNIHPFFVFDGPNKPLFKRNKKVGGPGVRVASVPEFLAKQLLKRFGFPWHVAPGEAEAECALLQREGIVDAVLSEDVDTLMFGSGVTLRNWTAENSTKSPTHVNVYRAAETKEKSGMDREGMILAALMSGGDYLPEGIPGCGPKVACDAARAGFGHDLCQLGKKDSAGIKAWMQRLQHQVRTNEAKYFSRKNTGFTIPEDFPNLEVLGYYTHPCVSSPEKLARLRQELKWDQEIDFSALRSFTADAFDWRCLGGAKKFIKNLAPAILIRELRLRGNEDASLTQEAQEQRKQELVSAIHGIRHHNTTDGELEYRISFTPANLVPIDLSIEEEDDQFLPAGGGAEDSDVESEFIALPSNTLDESTAPASPTKKRNFRPYEPTQPEKLWILHPFLQIGCPLLVEEYEASTKDPKEFLKQRRKARAVANGDSGNLHAAKPKKGKAKKADAEPMPENALMAYAKVTKVAVGSSNGRAMKELSPQANSRSNSQEEPAILFQASALEFKLPSTQIPLEMLNQDIPQRPSSQSIEVLNMAGYASKNPASRPVADQARPFAAFAAPKYSTNKQPLQPTPRQEDGQKRPRRNKKRPPPDFSSPTLSQRTMTSYYCPSSRKPIRTPFIFEAGAETEPTILISSSPAPVEPQDPPQKPTTPTPPNTRYQFIRSSASPPPARPDFSPVKLPDTVAKRRKKSPLKRWQTEPTFGRETGDEDDLLPLPTPTSREGNPTQINTAAQHENIRPSVVEAMDLIISSPAKSEGSLPSPKLILGRQSRTTAIMSTMEDVDASPKPARNTMKNVNSPPARLPFPAAEQIDEVDERVHLWLRGSNDAETNTFDKLAGGFIESPPPSSYPTPRSELPGEEEEHPPPLQPPTAVRSTVTKQAATSKPPQRSVRRSPRHTAKSTCQQHPRRSPRQNTKKKQRIQLRESLEGAWREVDAETIDMSGDGSGWKNSKGKAKIIGGWRKSGVEVLDLTGS